MLRLAPHMAPIKVAVLPLVNKDGQPEKARSIYEELRTRMTAEYDTGGSIGKRYRRQDEIGTPFGVTVDHQTMEDDTVTLRDRDTLEQERVPVGRAGGRDRAPARGGLMATATGTRITKTPHGDARVHLHPAAGARGALVLGHGAGGGVEAPDLVAATAAARLAGLHRGAGGAALPRGREALVTRGQAARRRVDRGTRGPDGGGPRRPPADRGWPLGGSPRGVPHGGGHRRGRRALPRVPATAAGARRQGAVAEPPARARRGRACRC